MALESAGCAVPAMLVLIGLGIGGVVYGLMIIFGGAVGDVPRWVGIPVIVFGIICFSIYGAVVKSWDK
ncbi:MAG TPA: hypothetical protein VJ464_13495 [Blastocatellia bacterium]|nr:hypothetical protein [Blastocatellia bacterium]